MRGTDCVSLRRCASSTAECAVERLIQIQDGARAVTARQHDGRTLDKYTRRFQSKIELHLTEFALERLDLHDRHTTLAAIGQDASQQLVEALIRLLGWAWVAVLTEAA